MLLSQSEYSIKGAFRAFWINLDGQCAEIFKETSSFFPRDATPANGDQKRVGDLNWPVGGHSGLVA